MDQFKNPCTVSPQRFLLFVSFAQPLQRSYPFSSSPFCQTSFKKNRATKTLSLRLERIAKHNCFGDSRVNFTMKLTVVKFPSADWLSYLRTQLKAFVSGRVCRIMLEK